MPKNHPAEEPAVAAFLNALDHPLKPEVLALRAVILGTSPAIKEGIKWNAPSFRTTEDFATMNLRSENELRLILHLGTKKTAAAKDGITIADPAGLIAWAAKDRGVVSFPKGEPIDPRKKPLQALLRAWMKLL